MLTNEELLAKARGEKVAEPVPVRKSHKVRKFKPRKSQPGSASRKAVEAAEKQKAKGPATPKLRPPTVRRSPRGKAGRDGKDGSDGKPGRDGNDGEPGRDGGIGQTGRDGKPGKQGRPGKSAGRGPLEILSIGRGGGGMAKHGGEFHKLGRYGMTINRDENGAIVSVTQEGNTHPTTRIFRDDDGNISHITKGGKRVNIVRDAKGSIIATTVGGEA